MHHIIMTALATVVLAAADANEFVLQKSDVARTARGAKTSRITATKSEAAMKFFVIDKDKGPVKGIVICLTAPAGTTTYYTDETDEEGYAEVLVPVGQKYEVTYLSLGRQEIAASVSVTNEPKQNVKLTLRYKRQPPPPPFVLSGINFDTNKSTIRPESLSRLTIVVEFMKHKNSARVEIAGHTDNVGNPKANKTLSLMRAQACRSYLTSQGIDGSRIAAVGFGDERPLGPNDTGENRQKNRRIEVTELQPLPAP